MPFERKPIVGVMGGSQTTSDIWQMAFELGAGIAARGWILLNGGRDAGIMRASAEGAKSQNGLTIGILPGNDSSGANPFIDIPVVTNMGDARNVINVLSSDLVIGCPGSAGTVSEISLALKNSKPVILLDFNLSDLFPDFMKSGQLHIADNVLTCLSLVEKQLANFSL